MSVNVPIIELATDKPLAVRIDDVAAQIKLALESSGFFYVHGHGIDNDLLDQLLHSSRHFFALPLAVKQQIGIDQHNRGYLGFGEAKMRGAKRHDLKEVFFFGRELAADDPDLLAKRPLCAANRWPDSPSNFKRDVLDYLAGACRLGEYLLAAIARAFDSEVDFFKPFYERPMARGQLIHYPRPDQAQDNGVDSDNDDEQFGVAEHTDFGCITLLHQASPGLEVRDRRGEWIKVPPIKDTLVVNVGDLLERWTSGKAPSTRHRVRNLSGASRYSVAIFYDPSPGAIVDPRDLAHPHTASGEFPPIAAADYILQRSRGVFAQFKEDAK